MEKLEELLEVFRKFIERLSEFDLMRIAATPLAEVEIFDLFILMLIQALAIYILLKSANVGYSGAKVITVKAFRGLKKGISKVTSTMFKRNPEICSSCGNLLEDCVCSHNKGVSTRKRYRNFKKENRRIKKSKRIKAKLLKKLKK